MTLAVITNRLSTHNRRAEKWIDPLLAGEPGVMHIAVEDIAQIGGAVRQCASAGANAIVVNGGDGTAGLIFGALLNASPYREAPAVALLPGGKTNMTAAAWSLSGDPAAALKAVLAHHRAGTLGAHATPRAVMSVRDGDAPRRYGAFFGAADIVEGILFCRKHIYPLKMPNAASHSAAISVLLWRSLAAGGEAKPIVLRQNENELPGGKFFVFAATTLDQLILGLRPEPPAGSGDGPLMYVSVDHKPMAILRALPDMVRRKLRPGKGRNVGRANDLCLTFTGAYTIDGEMYEASADRDLILDSRDTLRFIQLPT
ncbi:MAG: acylglycerol kinase family protein [Rhodospirillaceae bacterium]